MSVREATENAWIRKNALGRYDFLWRVENTLQDGTFDSFAIVMKKPMWIEIKAPIEPARSTTRLFSGNHEFTQGQKNFALSIRQAGGLCWGFIGTNLRQILIPGALIEHANSMTVDELLNECAWSREKNVSDLKLAGQLLRLTLAEKDFGP